MPHLGGVIVSQPVCEVLESDPDYVFRHGYTYSGHPVAAAAAAANIDLIERDNLVDCAARIGKRFSSGLRSLLDGGLDEVRGVAGVWAAKLTGGDDPERGLAVRDKMLELGVIARPLGDSIAFCPPLIITDEQIDRCIEALGEALRSVD